MAFGQFQVAPARLAADPRILAPDVLVIRVVADCAADVCGRNHGGDARHSRIGCVQADTVRTAQGYDTPRAIRGR